MPIKGALPLSRNLLESILSDQEQVDFNMALNESLTRFIQALEENPDLDIEEMKELIIDTPGLEIRGSSKLFANLCRTLAEALIKTKRSVSGINLLIQAAGKYQTHRSQLTSIHSDICLLCLDSKCLKPALKLLEIVYSDIKKTEDKEEDVKNVLLFYYYGGLIYAAVKNFKRASHFFEVVLTMPASVMNPIMQETYKRHIILSLLLNGKLPENLLPKYTSTCVLRHRKQIGHNYTKLANEYSSLDHEKIRRLIAADTHSYERDENMGLIKQCLTQVHKRNIQRLTKTFLTLPLGDVASHVGLASEKEAESYILNMIDDGEIYATINQKDGMVVFQDSSESFDTMNIFKKLQEDMSITTDLIDTLRKLDADTIIKDSKSTKMISDG